MYPHLRLMFFASEKMPTTQEGQINDWWKRKWNVRAGRHADGNDWQRTGGRWVEIPQLERSMGRDQPAPRRAGRQVRSDQALWAGARSAADAGVPKDP